MFFYHLNRKSPIIIFLVFGIWVCGSACRASEIVLEPFFNVLESPNLQAESHSWVDLVVFDDDYSPESPHNPSDYVLDENLWGTGMSQAFSQTTFAQADSFAQIFLQWDVLTSAFMVDAYTRSSAQSFEDQHNSSSNSIAQLAGDIGAKVTSDTLSDGSVLYCRIPSSDPPPYAEGGIGAGIGWHFYSRYFVYRHGPQWSGIYEAMPEEADPDFTIIQVGDKVDLFWHSMVTCQAIAFDYELETYEIGHAPMPARFDILLPGPGNITEHIAGTGQRFESSDQYKCGYAAMAMVMDYWADQYPDLRQPEPDDYYRAFDLCRSANDPNGLEKFRFIMNRYLWNFNGCRNGSPVPLIAPQVRPSLWKVISNKFDHPIFAAGPEVDGLGQPIMPMNINIGHAFVVDGFRGYKDPAKEYQYKYWMAVRDTWQSSLVLEDVVSVDVLDSEWGPWPTPRYTGFVDDEIEWWPTDDDGEYLRFPNFAEPYCFRPMDAIPIVPDWLIFDVYSQDFNRDDTNLLFYSGDVVIDHDEVFVTTVQSIQDEDDYILRLEVPLDIVLPQATVSFRAFVPETSNLKISLEYHLSPSSSLNLYANGLLLGPIGTGPAPLAAQFDPNNLNYYSQVFDMNSLQLDSQEAVFSLVFSGSSGRILHLDNFIAENLDVVWPAVNLDDVGGIDYNDFAILASVWQRQDCVAPFWCDGGDINQDHEVSFEDMLLLFENWLDSPR